MRYLSNVATLEYFPDKCTGCLRCIDVCPHAVFVRHEKKVAVSDRDLCMECGACMMNCAFKAINVDNGVGCAAAIINSMLYGGEPSCDCSGESSSGNCC
ncbi:MAG: mercury methylation ferredoxin HgcB [Deltaproteobacteria bacterium]|nr:mercury methylation ferredoxin HgcB [Deltaproteobacteria bacterium]